VNFDYANSLRLADTAE